MIYILRNKSKVLSEGFDMDNDYPLTVKEAKEKFLKLVNKN